MKMDKIEIGESSISTSSTSMKMSKERNQSTDNKIRGGGNSGKKMKRGESSNSCVGTEVGAGQSQEEGSSGKEVAMDNLPPEMLTKILKCVDTRSLFYCRLVNCQWSEISSGILTTRSDTKITFTFKQKIFFQQRANTQKQKTNLKDFLICMKESKNPPFARFSFLCKPQFSYFDYSNFLSHEDFTRFLSEVEESKANQNQNQRIKVKSLEFKFAHTNQSFEVLIEKLRGLLHTKIPHLEEFGLDFKQIIHSPGLTAELFPPVVPTPLPHLKVLHFSDSMILKFPEILKNVLNSAVNLEKIYLYKNNQKFSTELYDFLHPLGKFHLLKSFERDVTFNFLSRVKKRPDFTCALFKLELEELELGLNSGYDSDSDSNSDSNDDDEDDAVIRATNFMSTLFESSKNSLKELTMRSTLFLNRYKFPRFQNLTKLKIGETRDPCYLSFPRGTRSMDIFPAVCELDLPQWNWCEEFPPLDFLPIFPRVQKLSLDDFGFNADCVGILVLLCPNLKHLKTHRDTHSGCKMPPQINFLDVGRQIWTQLKGLESLEMDIDVESQDNYPAALDSCFTGISTTNCQRLFNVREAKKTVEKKESQASVSDSEIELMAKREHASILDMKDLKTLRINPYYGTTLLQKTDFFTNCTWVSEEYAFKFLPHLRPKPEEED